VKKTSMVTNDFSTSFAADFVVKTRGSGGMASLANGQLVLTNTSTSTGAVYLSSIAQYDLENSSVEIDVVSKGAASFVRNTILILQSQEDFSYLAIVVTTDAIVAQYHVDGTPDYPEPGRMNFNASKPVRIRIRSSGNLVFFERSVTPGVWGIIAQLNNPLPRPLRNMDISLQAGCYQDFDCITGTSIFDNLNVTP
jgi:hypothetical protein